jgi:hypothetical protein
MVLVVCFLGANRSTRPFLSMLLCFVSSMAFHWSSFADDIVDCRSACIDGFLVGFGGHRSLVYWKEQR